ncbi:hypothetical protein C8R44DRAFT_725635 [Mycena epipterygia]|nr:hypothetical protein C8R44DRAFT_725635 [Mycena epipterygia]
MSLAFSHLESNIWKAIMICVPSSSSSFFFGMGRISVGPIIRIVESSRGGLQNLWDQSPAIRKIIKHCRCVIADLDLICGDNLSYETAAMDGQPWERPEAIYAAHALPTLPMNEDERRSSPSWRGL